MFFCWSQTFIWITVNQGWQNAGINWVYVSQYKKLVYASFYWHKLTNWHKLATQKYVRV